MGRLRKGRAFAAYNACAGARPCRSRLTGAALTSLALLLALGAGGCSFSYQLDSLFGKKDDLGLTGSLHPLASKPLAGLPPEGDLAFARAAVSEVLSRGGKDASAPWENPSTGARGTVTPVAATYSQDGTTCREFLASYERDGSSSWLQGEACRAGKGKWEVKNLKPWQRT
jgi:outer membrane surface antigen